MVYVVLTQPYSYKSGVWTSNTIACILMSCLRAHTTHTEALRQGTSVYCYKEYFLVYTNPTKTQIPVENNSALIIIIHVAGVATKISHQGEPPGYCPGFFPGYFPRYFLCARCTARWSVYKTFEGVTLPYIRPRSKEYQ